MCRDEALMGAANALAAFVKYAGKVPHKSLNVLLYMALVSKDADEKPWYGMGHGALAAHALGRPEPVTAADIRAVERAIQPLLGDALTVIRKAAVRIDGPNTVRYQLNLLGTAHARQKVTGVEGTEDHSLPSQSDDDARHFLTARPSLSGTHARQKPSDRGIRGDKRSEDEEEMADLRTDLTVVRAQGIEDDQPSPITLPSKCTHGLAARKLATGRSSCALCRRAEDLIPLRKDA